MRPTKAIITIAGLGTRFLPATKSQPKALLPIVDKPVIHFLVEEIVNSGIRDIIFITGKGKRAIEDYFDYSLELENALHTSGRKDLLQTIREIANLANFTYVRQKEPLGDGDAILCASHLIGDEPVAVLFEDDIIFSKKPCLLQLIEVFEKYQNPVIAVEKINKREAYKYGIIDGINIENNISKNKQNSPIFEIRGIVEKPQPEKAPSNLAIVGKYIITPNVFKELEILKQKNKKRHRELKLAYALEILTKKQPIYGVQFSGRRYDCGSKIGFLKAIVDFGLKHAEVKKEFKKYIKETISI